MRFLVLLLAVSFLWSKVVWPPPPEKARIEWVRVIETPKDLGIEKSLWAKIKSFLFGEETEERIIKPAGVYADEEVLAVADQGLKGLLVFYLKEKKYKVVYGFPSPVDVVRYKDKLFVSDSVLGKVFVVSLKKAKTVGKVGEGTLERPVGLALDEKRRRLYVVDTLKGKVFVFDPDRGNLLFSFGENLARPTYCELDKEGYLYLSDSLNAKVRKFSPEGKLVFSFGERGNAIGTFANPRGIAVDRDGHIYVSDTLFSVIQVFDQKGELLLVIGRFGKGEGEFALPMDLFIRGDHIYVADSYNARIVVLRYLGGK
ncbi:MAG: 6-bladed beta-propeller [Thermotogae bacterium]|nr:6-bladed beta-propeller [Thermotogota bacterium]